MGWAARGWSQEGRGDTAAIRTSGAVERWLDLPIPLQWMDLHGDCPRDRSLWTQDSTEQHMSDRRAQSPGVSLLFSIVAPAALGRDPLPMPCSLPLHLMFESIVFWLITLEAVYWVLGAAAQPPLCPVQSPALPSLCCVSHKPPGDALADAG